MEGHKEKQYVLFSGVGYSDPVSGFHDGAILHIVRRYKPTDVYLFLTAEMGKHDQEDNRYEKGIQSLEKSKSIGDLPNIHREYEDIVDADNFDVFMEPFKRILKDIMDKHPGAQILLNLSSGTIQMKMTMCLLATDVQYRDLGVLGVQVRNWEKSNKTKSFAIEEIVNQLENNEDNKPGAVDRCLVAETLVLHRDRTKKQISALIDKYNYKAAVDMFKLDEKNYEDKCVYKTVMALLEHADARQEQKVPEANRAINALKINKDKQILAVKDLQMDKSILYPIKNTAETKKCYKLMEYFLILQNYQLTKRYTEMVVRMNPFVIALQEEYLNSIPDFSVEDICDNKEYGRKIIVNKIKNKDEELLKHINNSGKIGQRLRDSSPSIIVYNLILQYFAENKRLEKLTKEDVLFFDDCERINQLRNKAAHDLKCVYESQIINATEKRMDGETIIKRFRELLKKLYGDKCPEESFKVYDTINELIKGLL